MAKHAAGKLSAPFVRTVSSPGKYPDGGSLYFQVDTADRKRWYVRVMVNGKRKEVSVGPYPLVSLAEAREKAILIRKKVRDGVDPIEERREERKRVHAQATRSTNTLEKVSTDYIESRKGDWKNAKHAGQWLSTLRNHIFPKLGARPIEEIRPAELLEVMEPIHRRIPETATRIRQRLEQIWNDAILRELALVNAAAVIKPRLIDRHTVKSHAAMPYGEVGAFILRIRKEPALTRSVRLALEFTILTAARTSEVVQMQWNEADHERREWIIPAEKMKAQRPHKVPLTERALEILNEAKVHRRDHGFVFPTLYGRNTHLSNMAMLTALKRMKKETTVHGFRSSFSTWAYENTDYREDVIEAALAHRNEDKVAAAYNRAEYWVQRVALATAWEEYLLAAKEETEIDRHTVAP